MQDAVSDVPVLDVLKKDQLEPAEGKENSDKE
jgi:hypothetical protein